MRRTCQIATLAIGVSCSGLLADSARIDAIDFEDTPLSEAVEFFRQKGNGLNFVIDPNVDGTATATLKLRNISLGAAVFCLVESMNLDFRMDPHACFIVPKRSGKIASTPPTPLNQTAGFEPALLARERMVREVVFDELPLQEVVNFLATAGSGNSETARRLNLVIHGQIDPRIPIWIELENSSVGGILSKISEQTGLEIRVEPFALFIDPPGLRNKRTQQHQIVSRPKKPNSSSKRPPVGSTSPLWEAPRDPRKPGHPDYEDRMLRPNMTYKWVNGHFTFVRYAGTDPEQSNLAKDPRRIFDPVQLEPVESEKD